MFSFQDHYILSPFPFQLVLELGPGLKYVLGGDRKECIMICKLMQGMMVLLWQTQQASCMFAPFALHWLLATKHAASNCLQSVSVEKLHILKQGGWVGVTLGKEPFDGALSCF